MDDAAPAAGVAVEKAAVESKRPLLRRIPRSLFVTLLGIALTAWLLPAFTRQWDDRQKAQDVKASVTAEIAAATSRAVLQGREIERENFRFQFIKGGGVKMVGTARTLWNRVSDAWLVDRVKIDSRLRAYFPQDVLTGWRRYENTIYWLFWSEMFGGASEIAHSASKALGIPIHQMRADFANIRLARSAHVQYPGDKAYTDIVNGVLRQQNKLASVILAAHVKGYSTTAHDLLRDLIPRVG